MVEISDRGIVASLGAQWNQSRVGDSQYIPATDEEKAAALDAAIEFEDRMDLIDERTTMTDEAKEPMAPVDELLEVGERMKRDKARLVELCRMIAGGEDAVREAAIEAAKPGRRGRRKKVGGVNKVNRVPPDGDGVIKTAGREKLPGNAQYWKKVTCPVCGRETGSRTHEGQRYPILHPNAETGERCEGSFQSVGAAE